MRTIVLDSEAISRLARAREGRHPGTVHDWMSAARTESAPVVVPAAVLAELYRGKGHDQALDACLSRYPGLEVIDTTRPLARTVGHLLTAAGLGSAHHVDACVIAVAAACSGAVVLTSDPDDLTRLAAGLDRVTIVPL